MTIKELKEKIGQEAERIIYTGFPLEGRGKMYRCPNKSAHKNGDNKPSMSWDRKALQFLCFTCSEKIDIYSYYRDQKNMRHEEIMKMYDEPNEKYNVAVIENTKPEFIMGDLIESHLKYLTVKRGLSQETISAFKLGNVKKNIGIPYVVEGEVVGIKLKNMTNSDPKYFAITGSRLGLLNCDNLSFDEPLIITEGEFDAMSVYEAGLHNVVSVGTGGTSFTLLKKEYGEFLKKFKALIVFSDDDEVGMKMRENFLEEFGQMVKVPDRKLYKGLKDANEILLKHGKEQIKKIIKSVYVKIEGLINLADDDLDLDIGKMGGKYIPTGIRTIDYAINELSPSQVSLITGRSNGGKSTFVSQIITNAIDKGFKVLLVAGEGLKPLLVNGIYKNAIGGNERYYINQRVNLRSYKTPKPFVLQALKRWHGDRLTIFSKGESKLKTTEELLKMISQQIKLNKYDLVIIDNLMSVLSIEKASEKWERQADFMQYVSDLAKVEETHISVVLHPNKNARKDADMDFEDISGSSDIPNKADVIIAVKRIYEGKEDYDGEITVLKNRYYTDLPTVRTYFDEETGMLLELDKLNHPINNRLKWEEFLDTDDLIGIPEIS